MALPVRAEEAVFLPLFWDLPLPVFWLLDWEVAGLEVEGADLLELARGVGLYARSGYIWRSWIAICLYSWVPACQMGLRHAANQVESRGKVRKRHTILDDGVQEPAVFLELHLDAPGVLPVCRMRLFGLHVSQKGVWCRCLEWSQRISSTWQEKISSDT